MPRPATERRVETNSVVGPYNEGTDITLICESGGGKPIPQVTWFINNQQVPDTITFETDSSLVSFGSS